MSLINTVRLADGSYNQESEKSLTEKKSLNEKKSITEISLADRSVTDKKSLTEKTSFSDRKISKDKKSLTEKSVTETEDRTSKESDFSNDLSSVEDSTFDETTVETKSVDRTSEENELTISQDETYDKSETGVSKNLSVESISAGDKNVDELFGYIQKNLKDACEILDHLGDNVEHDIKLLLVDVFALIRKRLSNIKDKIQKSLFETNTIQNEFTKKATKMLNFIIEHNKMEHQIKSAKGTIENLQQKITEKEEKEPEVTDDYTEPDETFKEEEKVRENDLSNEVTCLRKEIERLTRERAEYENAVQRALLKGVSSLNVEALKVMRNPPACFDPCGGPAPSIIEPLIPSGQKSTQDTYNQPKESISSQQISKKVQRKTCNNANCPSARSRKKSLTQSILLLNDKDTTC